MLRSLEAIIPVELFHLPSFPQVKMLDIPKDSLHSFGKDTSHTPCKVTGSSDEEGRAVGKQKCLKESIRLN